MGRYEEWFRLKDWMIAIHDWACRKEFWVTVSPAPKGPSRKVHVCGSQLGALMLIVTEIAEAAEDLRDDNKEHHAEEMADAVIRILDYCEGYDVPLEKAMVEKMQKNEGRPAKHGRNF